MTDFLREYMEVVRDTEPPKMFQLWSAISVSSALLGRNIWFRHGHSNIYPNFYIMFSGDPGARKSSAIKFAKKLAVLSGYDTLAANKTTKEKFLLDFESGFTYSSDSVDTDDLDSLLLGDVEVGDREVYIPADEWLEFFGEGNINFATCLGSLWDFEGVYRERLKNSKSVAIPNPLVSILGGCTHETFKLAFPASMLGHGFLSRLLLIYAERSGVRITWPRDISDESIHGLVLKLQKMRHGIVGQVEVESPAMGMLDKIYKTWHDLEDTRFQHYSTRRFTQLLKMCLIIVGHKGVLKLEESDVLLANTILTHAELYMPKALGEFGAAKNSPIVHKILTILETATAAVSVKELWKLVSRDLDDFKILSQILQNLAHAEKIQWSKEKGGYLPKKQVRKIDEELVNFDLVKDILQE